MALVGSPPSQLHVGHLYTSSSPAATNSSGVSTPRLRKADDLSVGVAHSRTDLRYELIVLIGRGDDVLVGDLRVVWNERFGNVRSARYDTHGEAEQKSDTRRRTPILACATFLLVGTNLPFMGAAARRRSAGHGSTYVR